VAEYKLFYRYSAIGLKLLKQDIIRFSTIPVENCYRQAELKEDFTGRYREQGKGESCPKKPPLFYQYVALYMCELVEDEVSWGGVGLDMYV
jgi:hypothetical protein